MNTLVSIIIPLYNADKFIEETIHAVFEQTYFNFEIIAVNDGSKDNSLELLKKLQRKDGRLSIIDKKTKVYQLQEILALKMLKGHLFVF